MIGNSGINGAFNGLPNLDWKIVKHESSAFTGGTPDSHGDESGTGNPYTVFTVTGTVAIMAFWGAVNTTCTDAGSTATLSVGTTNNDDLWFAALGAAGLGGVTLTTGDVMAMATKNAGSQNISTGAIGYTLSLLYSGENIIETVGTEDITAGQIDYYCIWASCESGANIV